jgi:hypothetical protein
MYPEARHLVDPERTAREYNNMIGAPAVILRTPEEYQKRVQSEQQAAQMAQEAAVGSQAAQGAKAMSEIDLANVKELLAGGTGGLVL